MKLETFLEQLYLAGRKNDAETAERSSMMLNITPATGAFLRLLVTEMQPRRILELGTSNGYSTIWLADAARAIGARVDTVDIAPQKVEVARQNLEHCGLRDHVTLHCSDCGLFLRNEDDQTFDWVFLDSDRKSYVRWGNDLLRVTSLGMIVVDNALSHPQEMADFQRYLRDEFGLAVVILPIGNGQMIVQRKD